MVFFVDDECIGIHDFKDGTSHNNDHDTDDDTDDDSNDDTDDGWRGDRRPLLG